MKYKLIHSEQTDEIGNHYGEWTVVSLADITVRGRIWNCKCACGTERAVAQSGLRSGMSKSCGCLSRRIHSELMVKRNATHGMSKTQEYRIWKDIVKRCFNKKHDAYAFYGARGITIDPIWRVSFPAFLSHIGPRPSHLHSVDRINNDGNYEPGNVRWTTDDIQRRNCQPSRIHMISHNGKTMCMMDWAKELGVPYSRIKTRINRYKWPIDKALSAERFNKYSKSVAA